MTPCFSTIFKTTLCASNILLKTFKIPPLIRCTSLTTLFNSHKITSNNKRLHMYKKFKAEISGQERMESLENTSNNIIKSLNDPKDYRFIQLPNGLRALLISEKPKTETGAPAGGDDDKKGEKLAAAALCVGTGSFCDPPDIPGLAHFLEHMVFMGSEKYPNENEFDEFVKKHGGYNNAFTDCEHTVFYFNVEKDALQKGLDIFAGFFTKPLLKQDSVNRETKAVDSEFCMSKTNDGARLEQLLASFAKTGHPMGKFTWGNVESLQRTPEKEGIDIYQRLRQFHLKAYNAQYMTLAVQAMFPLDTLEKWVTEIFSGVPNNGEARPSFHELTSPFDTPAYNKLYKVIPIKNQHRVVVTWALPSLFKHYKSKPLHYLGFLVGHEGSGSILAHLRKKMWATDLEGGSSDVGFEQNTSHSSFNISIKLTEMGFQQVNDVILVVMQYMAMLRREGPKDWIFREIKQIEDNAFRWIEESDPVDSVESLVPNILQYPVPEIITGQKLYFQYDPQVIKDCLDAMSPGKANYIICSKKFAAENICNLKEKWYKTPYSVEDLPHDLVSAFQDMKVDENLHLPVPNPFITTNFDLCPVEERFSGLYPVCITENKLGRLYFKQDVKFKAPKAFVSFCLLSPLIKKSAVNLCMVDLLVNILEHKMSETAYAASVANLSYALKRDEHGFTIKVSGFNDKLFDLFSMILSYISSFSVDEELLETMKNSLQKDYYNKAIKPNMLNKELRLSVLRQQEKTLIECQQALPEVTVALIETFRKEMFKHVFIEGLIQGNLTEQEANSYLSELVKQLQCEPIPGNELPETRVVDIPEGVLYARTDNLNSKDENTAITNYYQHGQTDYHQLTLNELLMMRMEEPCFDILRTREQLGYSVHNLNRVTDGILGFSITVVSQAHKFTLEQLDDYIEKFLVEFEEILQKDTVDDFNTLRNSLITVKSCTDSNLREEVERNWGEILDKTCHFDIHQKQIDELKKITLDEVRAWFRSLVPSGGKQKKLSIQVEGHKGAVQVFKDESETKPDDVQEQMDQENDDDDDEEEGSDEEMDEEEENNDGNVELTDLILKSIDNQPEASVIKNVGEFQGTCKFYPVSRIKDVVNDQAKL